MKNTPANNAITGSFAPQGINGVSIAVVRRSRSLRMVRQAITPGMAQPVPIIMGMIDFPESPTRLKNGSITTATRAIWDHYVLHPETRQLLEYMLITLRDKGEDEAFRVLKKEVLGR